MRWSRIRSSRAPDADAATEMEVIQGIVTEIRQGRAANKIDKSQAARRGDYGWEAGQVAVIEANLVTIERLANVKLAMSKRTLRREARHSDGPRASAQGKRTSSKK